jgi:serpin B
MMSAPTVDDSTLTGLAQDNAIFAFDLFRELQGREGRLFFSPHSLSTALAMTYAGALGQTAREMAAVLHYHLPAEKLHPAFHALDRDLKEGPRTREGDFQLRTANSLWAQEAFPFRQEFVDFLARNYGSGVRLVDYIEAGRREEACLAINAWAMEETQGKIEELFAPGILSVDTRLVLANAIFFKGEWLQPFNPNSKHADFHNLDGTVTQIPLMARRSEALYAVREDFEAVELPYKGSRIAMIVILPARGRFREFESSLDARRLEGVLAALQTQDLKLYLPRFQFETTLMLEEVLGSMGITTAFQPELADFTGMYHSQENGDRLFLSRVVHKSFVAVDEIGTEAAAATGVVLELRSLPTMMRVDRPFIFLIRDKQTGAILFLGRVGKLP